MNRMSATTAQPASAGEARNGHQPPAQGQVVRVRTRTWLVESIEHVPIGRHGTLVRLACLDDDVLARNPEDVLGLTILATVYRRCDRDLAVCETMLRKAFAIAPTDARVMTALGALSAARGDYPIACRWFRLAIEAAPQWPTPHYGSALVCARNERWVDSNRVLEVMFRSVELKDVISGVIIAEAHELRQLNDFILRCKASADE